MPVLQAFYKSDNEVKATLTDQSGQAVTGATVTLSLDDPSGTEIVTDQAMSDDGSGEYTYTIADDTMSQRGETYVAKITAKSGGNTRYAEAKLKNAVDED